MSSEWSTYQINDRMLWACWRFQILLLPSHKAEINKEAMNQWSMILFRFGFITNQNAWITFKYIGRKVASDNLTIIFIAADMIESSVSLTESGCDYK